jgi:hypothetical protein
MLTIAPITPTKAIGPRSLQPLITVDSFAYGTVLPDGTAVVLFPLRGKPGPQPLLANRTLELVGFLDLDHLGHAQLSLPVRYYQWLESLGQVNVSNNGHIEIGLSYRFRDIKKDYNIQPIQWLDDEEIASMLPFHWLPCSLTR